MNGALPPGLALRDYADAELQAAQAGLGGRGGRIHAGVHRARKGLRRTRAVLALAAEALGPGVDVLDREFSRLNDGLSALRDAHALVGVLEHQIAKDRSPETAAVLRRAHRAAATARARCAAAEAPAMAERIDLLRMLRGGLLALPWDAIDDAGLRRALERSTARAAKARARLGDRGEEDDWHRWRRRMRRLSQQLRALEAAGVAVEAPSLFDKSLTEQLGTMQDFRLLAEQADRLALGKRERKALSAFAGKHWAKQRERIASVGRGAGSAEPAETG